VIEPPLIRPGRIDPEAPAPLLRVVAFFPNSATGNAVIQFLSTLGIPSAALGITGPDRLPRGQGMLLSIPCGDAEQAGRVEAVCRSQGAEVHRQPA
jgi:hypothetical protein